MRRLILASASPARRLLLEAAGLHPQVVVSRVDEGDTEGLDALEAVSVLARRKAEEVAGRPEARDALVVGCDSLLEFDGETWGKPASADEVVHRWKRMRGSSGRLHTGHVVVDTVGGRVVGETDTAVVYFGRPSDVEIDAYARTEESRQVAGPFTLEGRSAPWIDAIEGNYGTITGVSLPVLRRLLARLDVDLIDLWR